MQDCPEQGTGGEGIGSIVSALADRDDEASANRQRQPPQGGGNRRGDNVPARHAQQRPGDIIDEKANAEGCER